ncbi:MAG: 4Fe-4S cluster-binding domain-containing protein, partial [Clostridia bacterium]|nr:4Fe-4S cluster-binding domain-containing protein [Clostridia bacterium]
MKQVKGLISFYGICNNILGPDKRMVIYLQGCKKNCKGCQAPTLRELKPYKNDISKQLEAIINEAEKQDCKGITISGGEPFLQPQAIAYIQDLIKDKNMNLLVYTGYVKNELVDKYGEIISKIDV